MKIYVIGTGGVGGYYGGLLAKHGRDVTFVARGENYRAISKNGLQVNTVDGNFLIKPAKVISSIPEIEAPDVVLITVKTYDTEDISKQLSKVVNKNTIVLSLQNGIDNDEQIRKYIGDAIVVPGCVYIGAEKQAPGVILQSGGPKKLVFGSKDKSIEDKLNAIEKLIQGAGFDVMHAKDIDKGLWTKFLFIVPFAGMTSICRSSIGPIVNDPNTYDLFKRCLSEALQVAQKLGVDVGEHESNKIIERCDGYKHKDTGAKSSMLIDIENGRQTEIETLNGKICQLADKLNIDVPVNKLIYGAIRLYNNSISAGVREYSVKGASCSP